MMIHNWFKGFRNGNFQLKYESRSDRPVTINTDFIKAMLSENPRYTVQEIVDTTKISRKTE